MRIAPKNIRARSVKGVMSMKFKSLNAIQRGPNAIGRRIGRKAVGRLAGKVMGKI